MNIKVTYELNTGEPCGHIYRSKAKKARVAIDASIRNLNRRIQMFRRNGEKNLDIVWSEHKVEE